MLYTREEIKETCYSIFNIIDKDITLHSAQLYPNIKLMIVGVHEIGKTTLLEALRKEGQGSFKETDFKAHFNDRRRSHKSKSFLKKFVPQFKQYQPSITFLY